MPLSATPLPGGPRVGVYKPKEGEDIFNYGQGGAVMGSPQSQMSSGFPNIFGGGGGNTGVTFGNSPGGSAGSSGGSASSGGGGPQSTPAINPQTLINQNIEANPYQTGAYEHFEDIYDRAPDYDRVTALGRDAMAGALKEGQAAAGMRGALPGTGAQAMMAGDIVQQ